MRFKRVMFMCFMLLFFMQQGLSALDSSDAILDAQMDAQSDTKNYNSSFLGPFALSLLISPLIGGGISIISAYSSVPKAETPSYRLAAVQDRYKDSRLVLLYKSQYEEILSRNMKDKNVSAAWTGTGSALLFYVLLFSVLSAGVQ